MWVQSIFVLLFLVFSVYCQEVRIVNGTSASIKKFPYMVSIRMAPEGKHYCGGSIVSTKFILTAGHCVENMKPENISVQFGSTTLHKSGPNVLKAKRIIIHRNYKPLDNWANDIALIELWSHIKFDFKTIAPAKLPKPYFSLPQSLAGAPGVLTGWGFLETSANATIHRHLQVVEVKIYSDDECMVRNNCVTTRNQICSGVDKGGKGFCNGDSGGPLMIKGTKIQVGIVSWSNDPCGAYPFLDVNTKVSHYIDWIHENTDDTMERPPREYFSRIRRLGRTIIGARFSPIGLTRRLKACGKRRDGSLIPSLKMFRFKP